MRKTAMLSEQHKKRTENTRQILQALHFSAPLRRSDLSRLCAIRKSSITSIVDDLLSDGLVREEQPGSLRSPLKLNPEGPPALVASVTPERIAFACVWPDGRVEEAGWRELPLRPSLDALLASLSAGFTALMDRYPQPIAGLGLAVQGIVNPASATLIRSCNVGNLREVDLDRLLGERLGGRPVLIDNNVRCQLWASAWFERLLPLACDVLYVGIQEGVACAMLIGGRRVLGSRCSAGEIGHLRVGDEGRLCNCGKLDCLEAYCSLPAIIGELARICPEAALLRTAGQVAELAQREPRLANVLDRTARHLAKALGGLVSAMDPSLIVLATQNLEFSRLILPHLQRHLSAELLGIGAHEAEIRAAGNLDHATLQGIGALVFEQFFAQPL